MHQEGSIYKIIQECTVSKTLKKLIFPLRPLNISLHRSRAMLKISNVLMFLFFSTFTVVE
jgi:hypothetical protein